MPRNSAREERDGERMKGREGQKEQKGKAKRVERGCVHKAQGIQQIEQWSREKDWRQIGDEIRDFYPGIQ